MVNATRDATRHAEVVAIDRLLSGSLSSDQMCLPDDVLPLQYRPDSGTTDDGALPWKLSCTDRKQLEERLPVAISKHDLLKYCDLYVTCEPCIMCATALARVGISRVIFGCRNDRFGGCGSLMNIHKSKGSTSDGGKGGYDIVSGILEQDAVSLLREFYKRENCHAPEDRRKKKETSTQDSYVELLRTKKQVNSSKTCTYHGDC